MNLYFNWAHFEDVLRILVSQNINIVYGDIAQHYRLPCSKNMVYWQRRKLKL